MIRTKDALKTLFSQCATVGWNGYDAEPLSEKLFSTVSKVDKFIPEKYLEVFPCANQTVQYEAPLDEYEGYNSIIEVGETDVIVTCDMDIEKFRDSDICLKQMYSRKQYSADEFIQLLNRGKLNI